MAQRVLGEVKARMSRIAVDIYACKTGDVIVIDTGGYLSGSFFDYITLFLHARVCESVISVWFWDEDNVKACLGYNGIAIKLFGPVLDKRRARNNIRGLVRSALNTVNTLTMFARSNK